MKRLFLTILFLSFCATAFAGESQLKKATNVVNEIMGTPDKGIPHDLLDKAVCVGIVPSEVKFALGFGGTYGRGVMVCRKGGNGQWDAPSMFTMGGASVGFQIGGKATDVVFLVMNPEGMKKLVQDSVKLGAELSVAAGPVGRSAEGATDAQLHAEILSCRTRHSPAAPPARRTHRLPLQRAVAPSPPRQNRCRLPVPNSTLPTTDSPPIVR